VVLVEVIQEVVAVVLGDIDFLLDQQEDVTQQVLHL